MKTIRIAALDIANRHPLGLKCQTDSTYARFATELAELLAKQNIQGFEGRNVKETRHRADDVLRGRAL